MGELVPVQAGRRRQAVTATALRGLSRFADARGIPPGGEFLLDYDVIEAFCVAGLAGRTGDPGHVPVGAVPARRSEARAAGAAADAVPGREAPAPYSPAERAELAAVAVAQRDPAKRASALALVVFGIGAGLRPGELVALRGDDVTRHGRRVTVRVSGPAARVVPVTADYAGRAWDLARRAGSGHVFRPGTADRGYKNFVAEIAALFNVSRPTGYRALVGRPPPRYRPERFGCGSTFRLSANVVRPGPR